MELVGSDVVVWEWAEKEDMVRYSSSSGINGVEEGFNIRFRVWYIIYV